MSQFQEDILKILLDKALLGVIAMLFGFWLSRRLEDYRSRKSYDFFIQQQRVNACRQAAEIVARHFQHLMGLYNILERMVQKHPEKLTDEEAKPGYDYIEYYEQMKREFGGLSPFLPGNLMSAVSAYIEETSRLSDIVKGKFDRGKPTREELIMAHSRFVAACASAIAGENLEWKESEPPKPAV